MDTEIEQIEGKQKKENILRDFDDLLIAKKDNSKKTKAMLFCSLFVVLCSFVFMFAVFISSKNNVIVLSEKGEYLSRSNISEEKLTEALIKNTCSIVAKKANSFDRLNYQNRVKGLAFYVNTADLNAIYLKYESDKSYRDVIANGVVYSCDLENVDEITKIDSERFKVVFSSILKVSGVDNLKFKVKSVGEVVSTTPKYPYNVTGYFFNKLEQSFIRINEEKSTI